MARRGRPPHPGPLTPAEERVLALIREGKANAEIAVRLGVSVNTVRYHVSNLLAKAGAASREELARWRPRTEPGEGARRRGFGWVPIPAVAKAVLLATGGIVAAAIVLGVMLAAMGDGDEPAAELPAPFVPVDERALQEAGFVDTGPFLRSESGGDPVLGHSPRDLFTVLLVDEGPLLLGEAGRTREQQFVPGNGTVDFRLAWKDQEYLVHIWVVNQPYLRDRIRPTDAPEVVRLLPDTDGALFVHVTEIEANEPSVNTRDATNRATVSPNGHLWIQTTPLDSNLAADEWTGSALDTTGAIDAGVIDAENQYMLFTGCTDGLCSVSYRPTPPLFAPISGLLTCESSTLLRLDGSQVTLRFEWVNRGSGRGPPEFACEPHQVRIGDQVAPNGHYVITAYDAADRQISLAVSLDGHLRAGDFAPAIGCPCVGTT